MRLASAFFVGTLIFCHGVLGSHHITSGAQIPPTPAGEHASSHRPSGTPHELPATHHAEYFAVLLGTFLGSLALWSLLQNHRWRDRVFSAPRFAVWTQAASSNPPRGPTLHLLQVLRL